MSKRIEPTPEQLEIIGCADDSLIVSASAGAGKTAVLVRRYLRLVEDGLAPDEILTITFTKKAAAEMKERIVEALRAKGRLRDAQIAETGPIQTIHSFCERLLRENALDAGLDPRFEILGEHETRGMLIRAVRDALSHPLDERAEAERLISYLAGHSTFESESPYGKMEEAVFEVLDKLRGSGLGLERLEEDYCQPAHLEGLFEQAILANQPLPVAEFLRRHRTGTLAERLLAAYKEWGQKAPRWIASKPSELANREAVDHTAGLMQLSALAWYGVEREMERQQRLDFTALEARALKLLSESRSARKRVQSQFRMVMVDEAQDVNPTQHALIEALQIEGSMLVGDPQQSIYGFRLADPKIFEDLARATIPKRLTWNLRSDRGILEFVDLVFGRLWPDYVPMTPPPAPIDLDVIDRPAFPGVELWKQSGEDSTDLALNVRQMLEEEGPPLRDIAILVRTAKYAQCVQRSLLALGIPCRIAGGSEQFYARLEIRDLANTLRALGDPYDDFALAATLRSPVVGLSLDAIALLSQSKPIVNGLDGFTSPVEGDHEKLRRFLTWYTPLRQMADRLSAWEVLSELFAVSDYLPSLARRRQGSQSLANVRKLLRLATAEPDLGPLEFADQIWEIQSLRHREGDAPAVDESADMITILTIHKAKGLEWPVVIVPQTHRQVGKRNREVEVDARLRLAATKFGKQESLFHGWLAEERVQRETREELRLLYVALTRAETRLCLVTHPSAKPGSLAKTVAGVIGFGKTAPPGFKVRDSSVRADAGSGAAD